MCPISVATMQLYTYKKEEAHSLITEISKEEALGHIFNVQLQKGNISVCFVLFMTIFFTWCLQHEF